LRAELDLPAAETAGKALLRDGDAGVVFAGEDRTVCVIEGVANGVAEREGDGEAILVSIPF